MVICFPPIRNIPSAYNKPFMGFGSFTAAKYGTRCPAHEYGTPPSVECRMSHDGISVARAGILSRSRCIGGHEP